MSPATRQKSLSVVVLLWLCGHKTTPVKSVVSYVPGLRYMTRRSTKPIRLRQVKPSDVKTFLDVAEADALIWARWGAVKLEQNQWRCIVMNPLGSTRELLMMGHPSNPPPAKGRIGIRSESVRVNNACRLAGNLGFQKKKRRAMDMGRKHAW